MGHTTRETPRDEWERIGDQSRRVRAEMDELRRRIAESDIPKTARDGRIRRASEQVSGGLSTLRCELEERMAEEHPEFLEDSPDDFFDVFYGSDPDE